MLKYENGCVGCQLPCIYEACTYYRIPVNYCDKCGDYADVNIDENDFCMPHAEEMLDKLYEESKEDLKDLVELQIRDWNDLGYDEKCDILELTYKEI